MSLSVVLFMFAIVCFCVAIGSAISWRRNFIFTVPGTLVQVDSCPRFCRVGIGPSGCIYSPSVTLSWTFNDTLYQISNFSVGVDSCFQCCYQFLNKSIDVHIDPQQPSLPKAFYSVKADPEDTTDETLTIVFGILTAFLLFSALIMCCINNKRKNYETV